MDEGLKEQGFFGFDFRGMTGLMDFLQVGDIQPGVKSGGFDLFVTQDLLNDSNVGTVFQHQGGHGVTD